MKKHLSQKDLKKIYEQEKSQDYQDYDVLVEDQFLDLIDQAPEE